MFIPQQGELFLRSALGSLALIGQTFLEEAGAQLSAVRSDLADSDATAALLDRFPPTAVFLAGEEPPATFNTADGTWNQRAGVEERVRETMELSIPNEAMRRAALDFLALAIDTADEERGNAWCVREICRRPDRACPQRNRSRSRG